MSKHGECLICKHQEWLPFHEGDMVFADNVFLEAGWGAIYKNPTVRKRIGKNEYHKIKDQWVLVLNVEITRAYGQLNFVIKFLSPIGIFYNNMTADEEGDGIDSLKQIKCIKKEK